MEFYIPYDRVLDRLSLLGQSLELQSQTLEGRPFDLASLRGQVRLIEFWGTRCKPCIADFPALKRIYAERKPRGFEIVAVCLNSAPARGSASSKICHGTKRARTKAQQKKVMNGSRSGSAFNRFHQTFSSMPKDESLP